MFLELGRQLIQVKKYHDPDFRVKSMSFIHFEIKCPQVSL